MKGAFARYLSNTFCIAGLVMLVASRAEATPQLFGSNYYEFIQVTDPFVGDNNTWATANAAAAASTYLGFVGHLATVTSQAENDFLLSLAISHSFENPNPGGWLGGKAPEGWLVGPEAGQTFGYTNWGGIEPNNAGYLYMNIGASRFVPGQWADGSNGAGGGIPDDSRDPVMGYFVEYEGTAVPEPASIYLLGIGIAAVLFRATTRKRSPESR